MEKVTRRNDFLLYWDMIFSIKFMTIFVAFGMALATGAESS